MFVLPEVCDENLISQRCVAVKDEYFNVPFR